MHAGTKPGLKGWLNPSIPFCFVFFFPNSRNFIYLLCFVYAIQKRVRRRTDCPHNPQLNHCGWFIKLFHVSLATKKPHNKHPGFGVELASMKCIHFMKACRAFFTETPCLWWSPQSPHSEEYWYTDSLELELPGGVGKSTLNAEQWTSMSPESVELQKAPRTDLMNLKMLNPSSPGARWTGERHIRLNRDWRFSPSKWQNHNLVLELKTPEEYCTEWHCFSRWHGTIYNLSI